MVIVEVLADEGEAVTWVGAGVWVTRSRARCEVLGEDKMAEEKECGKSEAQRADEGHVVFGKV